MKTKKKWLLVPITAAMLAVGTIGSMSVFAATEPPATAAAELLRRMLPSRPSQTSPRCRAAVTRTRTASTPTRSSKASSNEREREAQP